MFEPSDSSTLDIKARYGEVDAAAIAFNAAFQLPGFTFSGLPNAQLFNEDVNTHNFEFVNNIDPTNDQETVEIAVRGALTGHLVLSTLHTNDAVSGISRLLDMGIEPFLISSSVRAFQAQRLVRTLCPSCKKHVKYEESFLRSIGFPLDQQAGLCAPVGCRNCRNTGFMGRLAIMEICMMTGALAEKINAQAPVADMKVQALSDGMIPMRQYGMMKAAQGVTTIEEVLTVTAANE